MKLVATISIMLLLFFSGIPSVNAHTDPYTFGLRLKIDNDEIEQTIVASLKLLDALMVIDRKKEDLLSREEAREAELSINEYFKGKNPLKIDGILVNPVLKEVKFVPIDPKLAEEIRKTKNIEPPKGDVHIIYSFGTKGRPGQVAIQWDLYPASLLTDPKYEAFKSAGWKETAAELKAYDEERIIIFTQEERGFTWYDQGGSLSKTSLKVRALSESEGTSKPLFFLSFALLLPFVLPLIRRLEAQPYPTLLTPLIIGVLALLLHFVNQLQVPYLSGPTFNRPEMSEGKAIFETLHRNIYRAFDYKTESDIYDALSQSVDGPLLDDVYNEVYQSLIMREEGGAFAQVQSVKILSGEMTEGRGTSESDAAFQINAHWQVNGAVSHWGHIHSRLNEYKARYTVEPKDDNWKITGVEILDQKRVTKN